MFRYPCLTIPICFKVQTLTDPQTSPIPGYSIDLITRAMMDGLNLVRGRCDKGAVWRVDVVSGTNKGMTESDRIAVVNAHSYSFYTNSDQTVF